MCCFFVMSMSQENWYISWHCLKIGDNILAGPFPFITKKTPFFSGGGSLILLKESIWVSLCCCYCWWGRAAASWLCAKLEYAMHPISIQNKPKVITWPCSCSVLYHLCRSSYFRNVLLKHQCLLHVIQKRQSVHHGVRLKLTKYLFVVFVSISLSARPELWAALIL